MMRLVTILILTFGFAACQVEGIDQTPVIGGPTRGPVIKVVDGGLDDAFPNVAIMDALPSAIIPDVQSKTAITDALTSIALTDVQPDIIVAGQDVMPNVVADARPIPTLNPCVYDQRETCEKAFCTPDQQNGIDFGGCFTEVKPVGNPTYHVVTCGWEPATNLCFQTTWCEDSVPSAGLNVSGTGQKIHLMPKSADCKDGSASFAPGTLRIWGQTVTGSVSSWNYGYMCVPNVQIITVNC